MKLNKNARLQTSFPQVWKRLHYRQVNFDPSKHIKMLVVIIGYRNNKIAEIQWKSCEWLV
jgi:hypothetical protein